MEVEAGGVDAVTGVMADAPTRSADVYVFCCHLPYPVSVENVLDTKEWEFLVAAASELGRAHGDQKTIGVGSLGALAEPIGFGDLRREIDRVIVELSA